MNDSTLPWNAKDENRRAIIDANGHIVGVTFQHSRGHSHEPGVAQANAALIVNAVNSHDALVAACRRAILAIDTREATPELKRSRDASALMLLRSALAKAKGE